VHLFCLKTNALLFRCTCGHCSAERKKRRPIVRNRRWCRLLAAGDDGVQWGGLIGVECPAGDGARKFSAWTRVSDRWLQTNASERPQATTTTTTIGSRNVSVHWSLECLEMWVIDGDGRGANGMCRWAGLSKRDTSSRRDRRASGSLKWFKRQGC